MTTTMILLPFIFMVVSLFFSMVGMGGGSLYLPILLFAGFSIKQAPAISLILILVAGISALFNFSKNNKVDWKLALLIEPPTNLMAIIGGYYSSLIPEKILLSFLVVILIIASILMIRKPTANTNNTELKQIPWYYWHRYFNDTDYIVNVPLVVIAAAIIGILAGMLGISGGVIKLPIMVILCGIPMDIAVATSTLMVTITGISGLIGHCLHETIEWKVGLLLATGALAGGLIGSKLSVKVDKDKLKTGFGILLLLVSTKILWGLFYK